MAIVNVIIIEDRSDDYAGVVLSIVRGLGVEELYYSEEPWFEELVYFEWAHTPEQFSEGPWSIIVCDDHFMSAAGESANALGVFLSMKEPKGSALWVRKSAVLMVGANKGAYRRLGVENADGESWKETLERLVREWRSFASRSWRGLFGVGAVTAIAGFEDEPGNPAQKGLGRELYFDFRPFSHPTQVELMLERPLRRVLDVDITFAPRKQPVLGRVSFQGPERTELRYRSTISGYCQGQQNGHLIFGQAKQGQGGVAVVNGDQQLGALNWRPSILILFAPLDAERSETLSHMMKQGVEVVTWVGSDADLDQDKFVAVFLATFGITWDAVISSDFAARATRVEGRYRLLARSDSDFALPCADATSALPIRLPQNKVDLKASAGVEKTLNQIAAYADIALFRENMASAELRVMQILAGGRPIGTGFLVGEDVLLTADHVVDREELLAARFDCKRTPRGSTGPTVDYAFHNDWQLARDRILDYAFVRLSRQPVHEEPREAFVLNPAAYRVVPEEPILIVGHPQGGPMQLSYAAPSGARLTADMTRVRYQTNTESGSSGSPVFNREWRIIALHRAFGNSGSGQYNEGVPIFKVATNVWSQALEQLDKLRRALQSGGATPSDVRAKIMSGVRLAKVVQLLWPDRAKTVRAALLAAGSYVDGKVVSNPGGVELAEVLSLLDAILATSKDRPS
ncbi:MAG: serine protease [Polyangiaceae bacterium]